MKKTLISIVLFLLTATAIMAQDLYPAKFPNGKYGYIDKNGNVKIEGKYGRALSFSCDRAYVEYPQQYINRNGNVVGNVRYQSIDDYDEWTVKYFHEDFVIYMENNKCGFLNKNCKVAIKAIYDFVYPFNEGLAQVWKDRKAGFINKKGKLVIPIKYTECSHFSEGLVFVEDSTGVYCLNKYGKITFKVKIGQNFANYFSVSSSRFVNGLAPMLNESNKLGYINTKGEWEIMPKYDFGTNFFKGLATVGLNGKTAVINHNDELVLPFLDYDYIEYFSEGYATVRKQFKYGVINTKGDLIIPLGKLRNVGSFFNGIAHAYYEDGSGAIKEGYINIKGEWIWGPY